MWFRFETIEQIGKRQTSLREKSSQMVCVQLPEFASSTD